MLTTSAQAESPVVLLPEGTGVRKPEKMWRQFQGEGFTLELHRNGGVAVHFGEASLYPPSLNMRLTPGSGQVTVLAATVETIRGEVRDVDAGHEAVITSQTSNGLEIAATFTVSSNRLVVSNSAKANWLIVRGSHPAYLGGMSFGSPHAPMTIVSRRGETLVDKKCEDAKSVVFRHRGKLIRFEFDGSARATVDPARWEGKYCYVNCSPTNVRDAIPPGESVGYTMTIAVREE